MQRSRLVLLTATLSACFSPEVSTEPTDTEAGDDGSGSSGPTGGATDPTSSPSGTSESETDSAEGTGETDSATASGTESDSDPDTTAGDAPPIFDSFTVNGSTTPGEVSEGGMLDLEADVSDDVGVVSVEFFDGDTSLGVVESSPYELEVPVSSADSGSHTFTAVATDTADQTTESDEVVLSVNIVGGEVLFFREQLFQASSSLGGPYASIATTSEGRVVVSGTVADTQTGRVQVFNEDLSSLWTADPNAQLRAPAVGIGSELVFSRWVDGEWTYARRATASGVVNGTLDINVPAGDVFVQLIGSRAVAGGDGLVVSTLPESLRTYAPNLSSPGWSHDLPSETVVRNLEPLPDGAVLIAFNSTLNGNVECATGFEACIRRVDADGTTAWTAGLTAPGATATREDGGVVALAARSGGGLSYAGFDANGSPTGPELVLDGDRDYRSEVDVAADGAGGLVVFGTDTSSTNQVAVVTRFDENGDLVWEQTEVAAASDSMGFSVAIFDDAAYVCGIEDLTEESFTTTGSVFAAKLRL